MAIPGALSRLVRVPGVSAFADIVGAIAELRGWLAYLRSNLKRDTDGLLATADEIKVYLREVGLDRWARYWHYGRQLISLQHRLFLEQIYSDLGGEWAKLVTGFGPLRPHGASIRGDPSEIDPGRGMEIRRGERARRAKWRYRGGGGGF